MDRENIIKGIQECDLNGGLIGNCPYKGILDILKEQKKVVRCKDCKWYDERISLCDNCGLPREQTFFCADGKMKTET